MEGSPRQAQAPAYTEKALDAAHAIRHGIYQTIALLSDRHGLKLTCHSIIYFFLVINPLILIQIRCTDPGVCTKSGVKVFVSDFTKGNQTDFVLSARSFSKLSIPSKAVQFLKMGAVDVDYKRILCEYGGQNMTVKVDESSKYPDYLAVQFLYQGGQTDITGVEVDQVGFSSWQYMTRSHGATWAMDRPPRGPLSFRLLVTGGYDGSWVWPRRNLLPSDWRPGAVYESGVQITEIAQEGCSRCEMGNWTDTHVN